MPSNEILRYVKRYLDERKLVGTVLNVVRPRYKDLSLRVVLIRRSVGTSRSPAQGHRAQAAPLPARAGRRPRRQGLGVRPPGAQDRADPPRRGGARRRGRRLRSRSATSSATSASSTSASTTTSCRSSSTSTSRRRSATTSSNDGRPSSSTARVVRVPDVVGRPLDEGAHPPRGRRASRGSSCCIARATRIATPCSSSVRRAARWSTRAPRSRSGSRAAATSSTCRRSTAAPTRSAATSCATCASCSSTCSTRSSRTSTDGWRFYDPHVAPPEFLDWLARWTAFTLDLDWPEAREARADQARRRPLPDPRHQARPGAVPQAVHRPRARHRREHLAVQGLPRRGRGRRDGARIGLDSVILPPVDLAHCFVVTMPIKFDDGHARDGDPHPPDHPDGEAGAHALLPAVRRGEGRRRAPRVLRDRPALRHRHRRRSRRGDREASREGQVNERERSQQGFKRINFFKGFLTTEKDWNDAERYHIDKRRLHNRMLHSPGIVYGYAGDLKVTARARGDLSVEVQPGYAIDGHGQRPDDLRRDDPNINLEEFRLPQTIYIVLRYYEELTDFIAYKENLEYKGHRRVLESCQRRALADRARHHARGRARAHLPREGRQPHPRRARSGRSAGQRDRPALRAARRRRRLDAAAGTCGCASRTLLWQVRRGALEYTRRGVIAAHDVVQALQHGADAALREPARPAERVRHLPADHRHRGRDGARRRRPPPDDRAEEGVLRVPPPGRDPSRPARREQEQHRRVPEPPRVPGEVRRDRDVARSPARSR